MNVNADYKILEGDAANDILATGFVTTAVNVAHIYVPIDKNIAPVSITVTSTFTLFNIKTGANVATGITPVLSTALSTKSMAVLTVSGVTGSALGDPVSLLCGAAGSQILINF